MTFARLVTLHWKGTLEQHSLLLVPGFLWARPRDRTSWGAWFLGEMLKSQSCRKKAFAYLHGVHLVGRTNSPPRTLAARESEKQRVELAATVMQKFILGKLGEIPNADQSTITVFPSIWKTHTNTADIQHLLCLMPV